MPILRHPIQGQWNHCFILGMDVHPYEIKGCESTLTFGIHIDLIVLQLDYMATVIGILNFKHKMLK